MPSRGSDLENKVSCILNRKFVTNISFATVRFETELSVWQAVLSKVFFFLRLLFPWGRDICLYRHNTLNTNFLTFTST